MGKREAVGYVVLTTYPTMNSRAPSMTDYAQFAHINHAGLKATNNGRGRDKKWTAKKILAEAARVPGNIAHVVNPQKPR